MDVWGFQMREYVEEQCKALTAEQRKQLAVMQNDIVFLLPEDVSVVFDEEGVFRWFFFLIGSRSVIEESWESSIDISDL